jgi:hypothetical protein
VISNAHTLENSPRKLAGGDNHIYAPCFGRVLGGVRLTLYPSFVTPRYAPSRVASQKPMVAAWRVEIESSPSRSHIP